MRHVESFQLQQVESSSLTRDGTRAPYIGSLESQPLDHQGSPPATFLLSPPLQVSAPFFLMPSVVIGHHDGPPNLLLKGGVILGLNCFFFPTIRGQTMGSNSLRMQGLRSEQGRSSLGVRIERPWFQQGAQLLVIKNLPVSAGHARDVGLIHGSGRFPQSRKW